MLRINGKVTQFWTIRWSTEMIKQIEPTIQLGVPAFQSLWEFVTLLAALVTWARPDMPLAMIGDNKGSLQLALSMRGRGAMAAVCREIAWRRIRGRWLFDVGHLPTESNKTADLLSRLSSDASAHVTVPADLTHACRIAPPAIDTLWHTAPDA